MTDKPLEGMKAILVVPTYGPVDPICAKDVRLGMMVASRLGLEWIGDASPDRLNFSAARNNAVASIYGPDEKPLADGIMWIDSDIRLQPSDIAGLLTTAVRFKAEFVSGVYHQRASEMRPVIYEFRPKTRSFHSVAEYPLNVLAPMGGCGFGFVWTAFSVIDAIKQHAEFNPKQGWFPDGRDSGGFGEDLSFCYQAIRAGKQLYVNTAILLGHVGEPEVVGRDQFLRKKKEMEDIVNVECTEQV